MAKNQHLKKEAHRQEMVERKARREKRRSGLSVWSGTRAEGGFTSYAPNRTGGVCVLKVGKTYDRTGKR